MLGDAGLDQLLEMGGESGERALFVITHQPGISRHVGGEDGGEATLDGHGSELPPGLTQAVAEAEDPQIDPIFCNKAIPDTVRTQKGHSREWPCKSLIFGCGGPQLS